jgi:type IV pilus assembly protein PilE
MSGRRPIAAALAQRGMTLIELMIVVAVIGIIVAVAYPSYQEHMRKARRAEAKSALLRALQLQERSYTAQQTYTIDMLPLFGMTGPPIRSGEDPNTGNYDLTAEVDPDAGSDLKMSVLLKATPRTTSVDPDCGTLTITSTGIRTANGTKGTLSSTPGFCWER